MIQELKGKRRRRRNKRKGKKKRKHRSIKMNKKTKNKGNNLGGFGEERDLIERGNPKLLFRLKYRFFLIENLIWGLF